MKVVFAKLALLATAALGGLPAVAATYYFSDCQADAAPACVAGSNGNAGTSPGAPKQNLAGFKFPAGPDHIYRFAQGGSFTNVYIDAPSGATFESYRPSWCSGTCAESRPILKARAQADGRGDDVVRFWFKRGITVRDLELRGHGGGQGYGVMSQGSSDITIDNLEISDFVIGIHVAYGHNGAVSEQVTIRNSTIRNNKAQGFLGGAKGLLLENNVFDSNGSDNGTRDHNIYLSSGPYEVPGITVRGNTLTHNTAYAGAICKAVALVGHGNMPNLTIENNTITETASGAVCWGIAINGVTGSKVVQAFPGLVIRGNTVAIHGTGNVGITCDSCPDAVIENNTIVRTGNDGTFTGVHIPSGTPSVARGDEADNNITVRNNTIHIEAPDRPTGISLAPVSASDVVVSNLVLFGSQSNRAQCLQTRGRSIQSFEAIDNNLCWRSGGAAFSWSDQAKTLGDAQAAGFDQSSLSLDPGLSTLKQAASAVVRSTLSTASPAINAGHRTLSSPRDKAGVQRDTQPDIGAVERAARPAAPASLTVQ